MASRPPFNYVVSGHPPSKMGAKISSMLATNEYSNNI